MKHLEQFERDALEGIGVAVVVSTAAVVVALIPGYEVFPVLMLQFCVLPLAMAYLILFFTTWYRIFRAVGRGIRWLYEEIMWRLFW